MKGSIIDTIIPINNCKNINSHYVKSTIKEASCPAKIPQQGGRGRCFGQSTILRNASGPQTLIDVYATP